MAKNGTVKALAYCRTSSAANGDGDSEDRQRRAILTYAERNGIEIAGWFYDAAVSGADPIEARPGFAAMLDRIEGNGVRLVLVEDASRFARTMLAQETGIALMLRREVRVVTSSGEDLTATDDPHRIAMRQMAGVFAELEKNRLVAKLRAARERKRAEMGRCGGRQATLAGDAQDMARRLRRQNSKTHKRMSLRSIAAALAEAGHVNPESGKPYSAEAIRLALSRPTTTAVS